jgi:hypothetical protein
MSTIIIKIDECRILEIADNSWTWEELKGDCFDFKTNPDMEPEELSREEKEFELKVLSEGVYGYVLQKWNPEIGCGWETKDSCFGLVGTHEENGHDIVDEFITQIYEG